MFKNIIGKMREKMSEKDEIKYYQNPYEDEVVSYYQKRSSWKMRSPWKTKSTWKHDNWKN